MLKHARVQSYIGLRPDYRHGYQRGLRRRFQGEMFGTLGDHEKWLQLAHDGADEASRERGRGYRDGLSVWANSEESSSPTRSTLGRTDDGRDGATRYSTK